MDHYQTLGVDRNASQDDIKKAYRKMASQHHPDKGGDTEKFQEIQAAYATLSDENKRAEYDNPQPQPFHHSGFSNVPPGFEDIFSQFGMFRRPPAPQNRTFNLQTSITLEDAFAGKNLIATIALPNGREQIAEVKIPAGVQDGTVLRLAEMGDDSVPNAPRGDIHLTVNVTAHQKFLRQGDDLITVVDVSCVDAMLGSKAIVESIDNKILEVTINPGTPHGQILSVPGYGMPKMNDNRFKGRLFVSVNITIPVNLTEKQKQLLKENF